MVGASIDHAPNCCGPCGGVSIPAEVPQSASQAVPRRVPAHRCFEWTSRFNAAELMDPVVQANKGAAQH